LHGLQVPFRLITGRKTGTFYMMQNKVSNEVFARFAAANPAAVATSRWKLGACARKQDLGVDGRDLFWWGIRTPAAAVRLQRVA
jgi:hypothetical protein